MDKLMGKFHTHKNVSEIFVIKTVFSALPLGFEYKKLISYLILLNIFE